MSNDITQDIDITQELFQKASLMSVHFGAWSGQKSQNKNDEEAQGAHVVEKFYKKGQKVLVDPELLKPFSAWRTRIKQHLERNATHFYIRGVYLVSHAVLPDLRKWLLETRSKIMTDAEIFLDNYDTARTAQIQAFNLEYPDKAGTFDQDYPTKEKLAEKFRLTWVTGTWNMAKLDEAASEERETFRQQSRSFLNDLAKDLRLAAATCCAEFLKSLNTKSEVVNDKAIERFKNFAKRFKNNNFLEDEELNQMMDDIENSTVNIAAWTSDEVTQSEIKKHLQAVVDLGKDEGAAAAVASQYVRRVSSAPHALEPEGDAPEISPINRRVTSPSEGEEDLVAPEPEPEVAAV